MEICTCGKDQSCEIFIFEFVEYMSIDSAIVNILNEYVIIEVLEKTYAGTDV